MRRPGPLLAIPLTCLCLLASCTSTSARYGEGKGRRHRRAESGPSAKGEPDRNRPPGKEATAARPRWKKRLDQLVPNERMSVHARFGGSLLYSHGGSNNRPPASNQKLLLTMALLDRFGPDNRITTDLAARRVRKRVIAGDLWIRGRGDPSLTEGGGHAAVLAFGATRIARLINRLKRSGIRAVRGDVMGSTNYFARDWNAPGWEPHFDDIEVALPTALALNGNVHKGKHTRRPELVTARLVLKRLEKSGIAVGGKAGMGHAPRKLRRVVSVSSAPLRVLVRYMNRTSSNFFAEILGKLLKARLSRPPGTMRGGARLLRRWARKIGVRVRAFDSSGLSYDNRMSTRGIVELLETAAGEAWGGALRHSLAAGGQGTLKERFPHTRIRAKTGTLREVSALSGWLWLRRLHDWAEFSILSRGIDKSRAVKIENQIVRILHRRARV